MKPLPLYQLMGEKYHLLVGNYKCDICELKLDRGFLFRAWMSKKESWDGLSCEKCVKKMKDVPYVRMSWYSNVRLVMIVDSVPANAVLVLERPEVVNSRADSIGNVSYTDAKINDRTVYAGRYESIEGAQIGNFDLIDAPEPIVDIDKFLLNTMKATPLIPKNGVTVELKKISYEQYEKTLTDKNTDLPLLDIINSPRNLGILTNAYYEGGIKMIKSVRRQLTDNVTTGVMNNPLISFKKPFYLNFDEGVEG